MRFKYKFLISLGIIISLILIYLLLVLYVLDFTHGECIKESVNETKLIELCGVNETEFDQLRREDSSFCPEGDNAINLGMYMC